MNALTFSPEASVYLWSDTDTRFYLVSIFPAGMGTAEKAIEDARRLSDAHGMRTKVTTHNNKTTIAEFDAKPTEEVITEDPEMAAVVAAFLDNAAKPFVNVAAAQYEDGASYRPLSHGGWFVDEEGEVM